MLHLLKPKNINSSKIRLGNHMDGGYIMSEVALNKCTSLFTYGVGHNITYEEDFMQRYNKPAYMFDHTMGMKPFVDGYMHYFDEGLGFEDRCGDVVEHYDRLNIDGDIILKVDIEGNEYDYFLKANIQKIASITSGLCIEVHDLSNYKARCACINMLELFEKYFTLVHVHGNNYGPLFSYEGHYVPDVLELSYVNKKLISSEELDTAIYPIDGLDAANNPMKLDYTLRFIG